MIRTLRLPPSGIILLLFVVISLCIANSPLCSAFQEILETQLGPRTHLVDLRYSLLTWVNDGLMALFFLLVGLEIKRELLMGELSSPKKATLPVLAALGGALLPAIIYYAFNKGLSTQGGWGIPMATDIAFALAIITLLGKKVPASIKVFLAALAIADDLMAIIVIAVFYTRDLQLTYLTYAAGICLLLILFNRLGVRNLVFYLIPGLFMWYFIHHSGIHATIAGVLTAMAIPGKNTSGTSAVEQLEHWLDKPVNYLIMPVFALVNTQIPLDIHMAEGLLSPPGLGILLGLLIGKPLGISLFSWISVKTGICTLPDKASWGHIIGAGMLGGIGFTMSIFIALLSFRGDHMLLADAKFFVLAASLLSGALGSLFLSRLYKP